MSENINQKKLEEHILQLSKDIYHLDETVYRELGSDLGRVFFANEKKSVTRIKNDLSSRNRAATVRHELALISNMARTIEDPKSKSAVMAEYDRLLTEVVSLPDSFGRGDVLTERSAELNTLNLSERFKENDHLIICIGRTHGCAGSEIGFALADALHINYYDQEIIDECQKRLASEYVPETPDHTSLRDRWNRFIQYHGLPERDAIFFNQSGFLLDLAQKEDFVIMGRYADQVLTNAGIPHVSLFINTSFDVRMKRVMYVENKKEKVARRELEKSDRIHRRDYHFYTGHRWGFIQNYDFCINSASYGIDGSVEMILRLLNKTRHKHSLENFASGEVIITEEDVSRIRNWAG